jgi:UDP-N-acetylmuramate: L-alanyl-gamma-D-glutamyl-meso-diaminopimelate ligase
VPTVQEIVDLLSRQVQPGDHVLIMSNGAFENIHQRLIQQLKLNLN